MSDFIIIDSSANFAKLNLTQSEKSRYKILVEQTFKYLTQIKRIKIKEGFTASTHDLSGPQREDHVFSSLPQDEALKNAPAQSRGFFCVPSFIKRSKNSN